MVIFNKINLNDFLLNTCVKNGPKNTPKNTQKNSVENNVKNTVKNSVKIFRIKSFWN